VATWTPSRTRAARARRRSRMRRLRRRGARPRCPSAGRLRLSARHVPRRWVLGANRQRRLLAPDHAGLRLSGNHRERASGGRRGQGRRARCATQSVRLRGDHLVLEGVALPAAPARSWAQARAPDRARALAGADRRCGAAGVPARADPHRWLARYEPGAREGTRLRVSPVPVLEPLGRHPALFTQTCDQIGVAWRPWGRFHVSVARREAVATLDTFIGPKA
jgi:hypothetical protein